MAAIVLVAGSFLGGWAWERVVPHLSAAGHDVHPLTLTGFGDRAHLASTDTSLQTHAQDIVAAIEVAGLTDVTLVAHSYAGAPATIAAARIGDRLRRLVLLAAAAPAPGQTLFDLAPPEFVVIMRDLATDGDGRGPRIPMMTDDQIDTYWGNHGLTPADRAWLRARAVGHPLSTYQTPAPDDLDAARSVATTLVVCDGDPMPPPTPLADALTVTLHAGHWPMVTRPVALADVIAAEVART